MSSPVHPPVYYSYQPDTSMLTKLPGQDNVVDLDQQFTCVRTMCTSKVCNARGPMWKVGEAAAQIVGV